MVFWNKKEIPPVEPPKKEELEVRYADPLNLDQRLVSLEMKFAELYGLLIKQDKYSGNKKLTKIGQSVRRLMS